MNSRTVFSNETQSARETAGLEDRAGFSGAYQFQNLDHLVDFREVQYERKNFTITMLRKDVFFLVHTTPINWGWINRGPVEHLCVSRGRLRKVAHGRREMCHNSKLSRGESAALGQSSFFKKYERKNLKFFT